MSFACCVKGCGGSFCFTPEIEARLRRTHEYFTCPFGHEQQFLTKTDKEKEIERLTESRDLWRDRYEETEHEFGTCPFCGFRSFAGIKRRWMFMLKHFATYHDIVGEAGAHPVWMLQAREEEKRAQSSG